MAIRIIGLLFLLFFLFVQNSIQSQTPSQEDYFHRKKFNAGIIAGLNASDLGVGWNAGIIGGFNATEYIHFSLELLFSQNGEYLVPDFYPNLNFTKLRFNYIEIPVGINYRVEKKDEFSYRKGWLRAGLTYTQLLDYQAFVNDVNVGSQIQLGKKNALLFNFGGAFFFQKNWGIDVRMSLPFAVNDLIPTYTFRGIYLL